MAGLDLERHHSIAQYIACGHSEWLAWVCKDNILFHNTLHVVLVNGSPESRLKTFYYSVELCTIHCVW